jgi:hypothetical protein
VCFHATEFAAALDLTLPPFDYIVTHGVYSWLDEANRQPCANSSTKTSNQGSSFMSATTPCRAGPAIFCSSTSCASLRDALDIDEDRFPLWRSFLSAHRFSGR